MGDERLKVICANLERRNDRRFAVEKGVCNVLGQEIDFLTAVDGSAISQERMQRYPEGTNPRNFAVRLTKRIAIRKFLRSEQSFLLFLEDDVAFTEDFEEVLSEGMDLMDSCGMDLVFLGGNHYRPPVASEFGEDWLRCQYVFGNHAVLFSRSGARKTLSILGEWQAPQSDVEIANGIRDGRLNAVCPAELVAFQRITVSDNCGHTGTADFSQGAIPYMLGDDLAVLDAALNEARLVVEYGSGASTVHLGNRLRGWGRLVSVTHDREWFEKVSGVLAEQGLDDVELLLREPIPLRSDDDGERFSKRRLQSYNSAPAEKVESGSVDLMFIDGKERIECALASAELLKPGGLLIIHDFWPTFRYRSRLPELLKKYRYLFESPCRVDEQDQGLAVFERR